MDSIINAGILLIIMIIIISTMKKHKEDGKIFYQRWLMWLGLGTLSYAIVLAYNLFFHGNEIVSYEFYLSIILIIGFLFSSIVALLEYKITYGEFGRYGITYKTPWSGSKKYSWFNIVKVEYNPIMNWYIFYTDDNNKMRFSSYLSGIDDLIKFANDMGHEIEVNGKIIKIKSN